MNASSSRRRGFTLVELLTVVLFVLLLAGIGLLRYIDLTREAYSSQVAGDLAAVRAGALAYYGDNDGWPQTAEIGTPPPGLEQYVPGGIFNRPQWRMGWVNVSSPGQAPFLGITVVSDDPGMMRKLTQRFGTRYPFLVTASSITFLMSTPTTGY